MQAPLNLILIISECDFLEQQSLVHKRIISYLSSGPIWTQLTSCYSHNEPSLTNRKEPNEQLLGNC